ncbi:hypothetical protein [Paraburkholderia sp. BCC1886]|uniref:hypothetical protein n=1 Tax=Paraburkholderia sp. BCC1886 TaxID=2562670 RepID=UPI001183B380|nr:hypothetical protein [Paraburkholderia sp. BCC1886]
MQSMFHRNVRFILVVVAFVWLTISDNAWCASATAVSASCVTRLPGPASRWTAQEQWVWQRLCTGQVADLQTLDEPGGMQTSLSAGFIEKLMVDPRLRGAIEYRGVDIHGARISAVVDLDNAHVTLPLTLSHCRFDQGLRLAHAVVDAQVLLDGSQFDDGIDMGGIKTSASLVLDGVTVAHDVNLVDADIGGQLSLNAVDIKGVFKAGSANVTKGFYATGATFSEVRLTSLKIGDELNIRKTTITGPFAFDSAEVGQSAHVDQNTVFKKDATFSSTRVLGQLDMSTAQFDGTLRMENLAVGRSLIMRGTSIGTRASMTYLSVGGNLELSGGGSFATLDLTGARIGQGLRLGSASRPPPHWQAGAQLILRNASARDIQDLMTCQDKVHQKGCVDGWAPQLDLVGFTYENPSALDIDAQSDMAVRTWQWWVGWLDRQSVFQPQTYAQAARMLDKINQGDKAIDILYAGKTHERRAAAGLQRILLTLHWMFVGYGFRTSYALWWSIGFVVLGVLVLKVSGERKRSGELLGFAFSADMLLPIIRLREAHYDIDLHGWARYYFYFHKVMGYVLASFLIAGLAGLVSSAGK